MARTLLEALQELGRDNLLTRAGQYWSADNAQFEQRKPTLPDRVVRGLNPMTGFGSAMGAMHDAAGNGSAPDAALALLQALPLFGATKTLPAMGALKARAAPAFGKMAISALGSGTALAVAEDNSEAPNARKWQR